MKKIVNNKFKMKKTSPLKVTNKKLQLRICEAFSMLFTIAIFGALYGSASWFFWLCYKHWDDIYFETSMCLVLGVILLFLALGLTTVLFSDETDEKNQVQQSDDSPILNTLATIVLANAIGSEVSSLFISDHTSNTDI